MVCLQNSINLVIKCSLLSDGAGFQKDSWRETAVHFILQVERNIGRTSNSFQVSFGLAPRVHLPVEPSIILSDKDPDIIAHTADALQGIHDQYQDWNTGLGIISGTWVPAIPTTATP